MNKGVKKFLKITGIVLLSVIALAVLLVLVMFLLRGLSNIARVDEKDIMPSDNPYIVEGTLISAHRAGRKLAPENTIAAFSRCFALMEENNYEIDTLEFDLQLTSDGYLVLLHDGTLDRTSNCTSLEGFGKDSKVIDHTLAELKTLEMWHDYDGDDFSREEARICTLQEVFDYVLLTKGYADMSFIIEIKDGGETGEKAMDELYRVMTVYDVVEQVVVGTFQDNVTLYIDAKYTDKGVIRSASIKEVLSFYFAFTFNTNLSEKGVGYKVLQIPTDDYVLFDFGKKSIIDYAHCHGIAVQFWTINDAKEIKELMEIGADTIMTDYPDVANQVAISLK